VNPIAACGAGLFVLDSGERGLERDPDHPIESPVLVLRVILGPQRFGHRKPLDVLAGCPLVEDGQLSSPLGHPDGSAKSSSH